MIDKIKIPVLNEIGRPLPLRTMMDALTEQTGGTPPREKQIMFDGDPALNECTNVLLIRLERYAVAPIIETVLPKKREDISLYLNAVINLFNECYPETGELRFRIGSTSEAERKKMFGEVLSLAELSKLFEKYPKMKDRKIILVMDEGKQCDMEKIQKLFPMDAFSLLMHGASEDFIDEVKSSGYEVYIEESEQEERND